MAADPIILPYNPVPEIMPDPALAAGAARSKLAAATSPNQVNNALAFPGIFRGALDNRVRAITDQHKIAAAEAIAGLVAEPSVETDYCRQLHGFALGADLLLRLSYRQYERQDMLRK